MKRAARGSAVVFLLLTSLAGCQPIATMLYVLSGAGDIKAEYTGLQGKRVAVVCHPLVQLQYRNSGVCKDIAKQVGKKLKEHDSSIQLISRTDVDRWTDENNSEDYVALGKGLKADMVVGVDLELFSDLEGATLYRGQAICKIAVFDVKVGHDPVWERHMPKLLYPPNAAQPANDCPEPEFCRKFVDTLAESIARHFYDHALADDFGKDADALQ